MADTRKTTAASAAPEAEAARNAPWLRMGYLIGRLDRVVRQLIESCIREIDVTVPQYTAMSVIHVQGGLSNAELARRSLITPQSANELVKILESRGWIERSPHPANARVVVLKLTQDGLSTLRQCDRLTKAMERDLLAGMDQGAQTQLKQQLKALLLTGEQRLGIA